MITRRQHNILRHALGLHESDIQTQNHYFDRKDSPDCRTLVNLGYMTEAIRTAGGYVYYHVTDRGFVVATDDLDEEHAR